MKNFAKLALIAAGVLMFTVPAAFADSVSITGAYAFPDNGYGIPPYPGLLNGQSANFYCVDFSHDITGGDAWSAIPTSLTSTNFSSTYQYKDELSAGLTASAANTAADITYLEFAYLITQMQAPGATQLQQAQDQWAIWSLSGATDPYGTGPSDPVGASVLLGQAYAAVTGPTPSFTGQGWEILTPNGSNNADGDTGQEFLVPTPVPAALLLLAMGLCGRFLLKRRVGFSFSR